MRNRIYGRPIAPSALLLGLVVSTLFLSSCSWLPFEAPEESGHSEDDAVISKLPEPTIIESSAPVETEEARTILLEPLKPEVEYSFFGLPSPEVTYQDSGINMQQEIDLLCSEVGQKLGSVSLQDCLDQDFSTNQGFSVLGRPLAMREFPELENKEPLGRVLVIGGIHGDEFSSVSIVFKWMEILNEHHSGLFHWLFVPISNPDGLLAERSTRQNNNGVDLNRNFPSADWAALALSYWQDRTDSNSRRFPGSSAGSEPEVEWLVRQIKEFKPDVIISVHAPYHLVDYDGPPEAPERLGDLKLSKLGVFPGSLGNYAGLDLDMPVVTIELPYAGIMPDPEQISRMWTDLVAWLVEERSKITDPN